MSDANTDRPALSPPAEVRVDGMTVIDCATGLPCEPWRPTPAPVDHIGDATEMMAVDWQRVGPKLVEAVQRLVDQSGPVPKGELRAALAAAQPEGK